LEEATAIIIAMQRIWGRGPALNASSGTASRLGIKRQASSFSEFRVGYRIKNGLPWSCFHAVLIENLFSDSLFAVFRARQDVVAQHFVDRKTGKSHWFPICRKSKTVAFPSLRMTFFATK
jgi:hypothetical protein